MKPGRKTIVIADKGAFTRDLLRIKLQALGHTVLLVENGMKLVELVKKTAPDLILMDIFLPSESDGLRACQEIKAGEETQQVPIILLSTKANDPQVLFQYNIWVKERIAKPFSPKHVIQKITECLS